ncbi:MAG: type IV pilus twitching motility protein PilT [Actinomycetota bacterium]
MAKIEELMDKVVEREASDMHLTSGLPPVLRIDGRLIPLDDYPKLGSEDVKKLIYEILTEGQRVKLERDLELDLSYSLPGKARFRVNVYWQRGSVGAALRLIPFNIKSPEELGLPKVVEKLARKPRGFILVTGPTGCGKSTTIASMINIINQTRDVHVMTIEDPIEFLHAHGKSIINQREVGIDSHSFTAALRHVLRQDPDVILVGEMRDLETISIALTAAETGHLVFASLHTQDAPQSIDRIVDVFPPQQQHQIRIQLAGTLQAILAQQLLPRKDGTGRIPAMEVMIATPAIRNMIREQKVHQIYTAMQSGYNVGMQTMDQALANLVKANIVSYQEAFSRAINPEEFNRIVGPVSSGVL